MANKTRVQRFKKHRDRIMSMDDGDLPIASIAGKHRYESDVKETPPLKIDNRRKRSEEMIENVKLLDEEKTVSKKAIPTSFWVVLALLITIAILVAIGIILDK